MTTIFIVSGFILALGVVIFLYYRRLAYLTKNLELAIERLKLKDAQLAESFREIVVERDRARESSRAKEEFLHSMSHELCTPLNAISGFSRQLTRKITSGDEKKLVFYAERILRNAGHLAHIVDNILIASTFPDLDKKYTIHPVLVSAFLEENEKLIREYIPRGVELRIIDETPKDLIIYVDRDLVNRILVNLLSNAIKFTVEGVIELKATADDSGRVTFSVADTGPGIPPGEENNIFEKFTKLDSFKPGIGLGLYTSRCLAELIGARLTLERTSPSGSLFSLSIP